MGSRAKQQVERQVANVIYIKKNVLVLVLFCVACFQYCKQQNHAGYLVETMAM
jgi:hypothetical protein